SPQRSVYGTDQSPHLNIIHIVIFTDMAPTQIYTLSLHDALPISECCCEHHDSSGQIGDTGRSRPATCSAHHSTGRSASIRAPGQDRKSTRLNSSHVKISYAVFCLKKKKK